MDKAALRGQLGQTQVVEVPMDPGLNARLYPHFAGRPAILEVAHGEVARFRLDDQDLAAVLRSTDVVDYLWRRVDKELQRYSFEAALDHLVHMSEVWFMARRQELKTGIKETHNLARELRLSERWWRNDASTIIAFLNAAVERLMRGTRARHPKRGKEFSKDDFEAILNVVGDAYSVSVMSRVLDQFTPVPADVKVSTQVPPDWAGHVEGLLELDGRERASARRLILRYRPGPMDLLAYIRDSPHIALDSTHASAWTYYEARLLGCAQPPARPELDRVSEQLQRDAGFSLDDLFQVLSLPRRQQSDDLPEHWALPEGRLTNRYDLLALDEVNRTNLTAALDALTMSPQVVKKAASAAEKQYGFDPTALHRNPYRLVTHPFVEIGPGSYLSAPYLAEYALQAYIGRLDAGGWPVHRDHTGWPNFEQALRGSCPVGAPQDEWPLKTRLEQRFEAVNCRTVAALGLPWITSDTDRRIGTVQVTQPDQIMVDAGARLIWVIENKHLAEDSTLLNAKGLYGQFFGEHRKKGKRQKNYKDQLDAKVSAVREDPQSVAEAICRENKSAVPEPGDWDVRGLWVIRDLGPLGFLTDSPYPVVSADMLASHIRPFTLSPQAIPAAHPDPPR